MISIPTKGAANEPHNPRNPNLTLVWRVCVIFSGRLLPQNGGFLGSGTRRYMDR